MATTALMTPMYPIIGFNQLVFRYLSPPMQAALSSGTGMLYFSAMVLGPHSVYYAPMLLPFAASNAVVSAAVVPVAVATAVALPREGRSFETSSAANGERKLGV